MYGRQGLLCAHIEHLLAEVAAAIPVLAEAESHTPIIILQIFSGVLSILGPGSEGLLGGHCRVPPFGMLATLLPATECHPGYPLPSPLAFHAVV